MEDYIISGKLLGDIADAIREKTGETGAIVAERFPEAIASIEGGGGGDDNDVVIGDGNTHIWISLSEGRTSPMLSVCPNGTVTVDWGDGTTPDTLTGTSTTTVKRTPKHNYASAGDYVITLTVDGEMGFYNNGGANGNANQLLANSTTFSDVRNRYYGRAITKIEIGSGITSVGNNALQGLAGLRTVTIPESVKSIGTSAFYTCYSLTNVTIPDGTTSIGESAFRECRSLTNLTIPDGVTSIGGDAFYGCFFASLTIPSSVTSIGNYAFSAGALAKVRFEATTPPILGGSSAFSSPAADIVFSVPTGTLSAYTSATNYPSSSKYAYIEED